jgi:DNA-binding NtrC family response regulator
MAQETARILIVDDHDNARQSMVDTLCHSGHRLESCSNAAAALRRLKVEQFEIVVSDLRMPGMSGLDLLKAIKSQKNPQKKPPSVILITAHGTVITAVDAMRHGAFDFIEKPFAPDQLESLVQRAILTGKAVSQQAGVSADELLIGDSPQMQVLRQRLTAVAQTDETVLIVGESGTGKELIAKTLHRESRRADEVFVALNCPALSPQLMESELFGHEKGAYTGADGERIGRFELANRGTLLLDEVSEIAPTLQAKLLRVLQERSFERVGSNITRPVDIRVIACTNRQLGNCVREGSFREDLFFRLAVLPIQVPPLRERPSDIPLLCEHFLDSAAVRLERNPCRLDTSAARLVCEYRWPGNVRELQNLMTRGTVLSQGETITGEQLRDWIGADGSSSECPSDIARNETPLPGGMIAIPRQGTQQGSQQQGSQQQDSQQQDSQQQDSQQLGIGRTEVIEISPDGVPVGISLGEMERRLIEATLQRFGGHREKTSHALGIGVRTLNNKLRAYGYAPRARFANEKHESNS